jgi:exonuclease V gamma subunit
VADARDRLAGLLTLYREGQGAPLPFYPAVSLAYAEALAKGEGPDAALLAAGRAWDGSPYQRGAREDPYVALAERGRDPLGGRFAALAVEVFAAMLAAEEAGRGGGLE